MTVGFLTLVDEADELFAAPSPPSSHEPAAPEALSLIDTGSFNDWLLTVQIIERAKKRFREIENRLAPLVVALAGREFGTEPIPFGLEHVCGLFHDALQNLGASRRTRQALLIAFEQTAVKQLGELHAQLITVLQEAGLKTSDSPGGVGSRSPTVPDTPTASTPEPESGQLASAAAPIAAGTVALDLSALIIPGVTAHHTNAAATEHYTDLDQLIETLADFRPGDDTPGPLSEAIERCLETRGLSVDPETFDLMDLTANLIDAVVDDPLCDPAAAKLIRKLTGVLLITVVRGDVFFTQHHHIIRDFIDVVGVIRTGPQDPDGVLVERLTHLFDSLHHQDVSTVDFEKALALASPIHEHQQRDLAACLHNVRRRFEQQSGAVQAYAPEEMPASPQQTNLPLVWKTWLGRTQQLSIGDMLLVDIDKASSRVTTIAWRKDDATVFGLVYLDDLSNRKLTLQELAMDLFRANTQKIEGGRLSVTERALCTQLHRIHRQVKGAATNDPLSKLANRRFFAEQLRNALLRANNTFESDTLALIQLDNFPQLKSICGAAAAKQLLQRLGENLSRQVGEAGTVCRYKGPCFGVHLHAGDPDDVLALMQRYRRSVEEARCVFNRKPYPLSVTIGMASIRSDHSGNVNALLSEVAALLKEGLASGGNQVIAQSEPTDLGLGITRSLEPNVEDLIREERLGLRAQLVKPISDPELRPYFEVLLGVRDDDGGLQSPFPVISAAEARGEIGQLDRWVVSAVLDWLHADQTRLAGVEGYAVNLSGITLNEEPLADYIIEQLAGYGIPPEKLIFEVTETAGIDSLSVAQKLIHTLREQGCHFSLDDFGVGHGSFAYLRSLPVDKIKIDGMFIKELETQSHDHAVVSSINEIAHFMGHRTVAEFVENDEILAILRRIGVDYAQGYALHKPQPIDELDLGRLTVPDTQDLRVDAA